MTDQPVRVSPSQDHDLPAVVREAEAELQTYRWRLGLAGVGWSAAWLLAFPLFNIRLPLSFLTVPLAGIGAALLLSPTRRVRWARELLRRWDSVRIERAFDGVGAPSDSRLEAAQAMAERVLSHGSVDERLRRVVEGLLESIRRSVDDLRTIDLVRRSEVGLGLAGQIPEGAGSRSADVRAQVELKIARLLTSLQEMHEAVIGRDAAALGTVLNEAETLIGRLVAENEVEAMLEKRS